MHGSSTKEKWQVSQRAGESVRKIGGFVDGCGGERRWGRRERWDGMEGETGGWRVGVESDGCNSSIGA